MGLVCIKGSPQIFRCSSSSMNFLSFVDIEIIHDVRWIHLMISLSFQVASLWYTDTRTDFLMQFNYSGA